jgi:flavin reductase (DIM6/NTAB) family NADH-FMN oxidoreductase RutF
MWVACEMRDLIDGGDHLIVTGTVREADSRDAQPLLFHRGAYRDLLAES